MINDRDRDHTLPGSAELELPECECDVINDSSPANAFRSHSGRNKSN